MRLSRQTALALAMILGLLAVVLAYTYLRGKQPSSEPVAKKIELPVPIETIPPDTDLRRDMFQQVAFDVDKLSRDTVTDPDRLHGRITLQELPKGKPITASAIAVRSTALALAYGIPLNYRAVTIPVDDVSGVANLIRPGDYVDVLSIFTDDTGRFATVQTVLQDLEVLAINTTTNQRNNNGEGEEGEEAKPATRRGEGSRTVTLAVTAHEAQLLVLSHHRGHLRLSLRRTGDREIMALGRSQSWSLIGTFPTVKKDPAPALTDAAPPPNTWAEMWGGPPMAAPAAPVAPVAPTPPKEPTVEVIRGSTREFIKPIE